MKTLSLNIVTGGKYDYSVYREVFEHKRSSGETMLFRIDINTRYHHHIELSVFSMNGGFNTIAGFFDIEALKEMSCLKGERFKFTATENANLIKRWVREVFH